MSSKQLLVTWWERVTHTVHWYTSLPCVTAILPADQDLAPWAVQQGGDGQHGGQPPGQGPWPGPAYTEPGPVVSCPLFSLKSFLWGLVTSVLCYFLSPPPLPPFVCLFLVLGFFCVCFVLFCFVGGGGGSGIILFSFTFCLLPSSSSSCFAFISFFFFFYFFFWFFFFLPFFFLRLILVLLALLLLTLLLSSFFVNFFFLSVLLLLLHPPILRCYLHRLLDGFEGHIEMVTNKLVTLRHLIPCLGWSPNVFQRTVEPVLACCWRWLLHIFQSARCM